MAVAPISERRASRREQNGAGGDQPKEQRRQCYLVSFAFAGDGGVSTCCSDKIRRRLVRLVLALSFCVPDYSDAAHVASYGIPADSLRKPADPPET